MQETPNPSIQAEKGEELLVDPVELAFPLPLTRLTRLLVGLIQSTPILTVTPGVNGPRGACVQDTEDHVLDQARIELDLHPQACPSKLIMHAWELPQVVQSSGTASAGSRRRSFSGPIDTPSQATSVVRKAPAHLVTAG